MKDPRFDGEVNHSLHESALACERIADTLEALRELLSKRYPYTKQPTSSEEQRDGT